MSEFKRVFVLGAGLIGGSLARKLRKEFGKNIQLIAFSRNPEKLLFLGKDIFDEALEYHKIKSLKFEKGDFVVIALPPILSLIHAWTLPPQNPEAIFIDVTSVKLIFSYCCNYPNFVPTHPMAGSHLSGFHSSKESLFERKTIFLTPLEKTSQRALRKAEELWQATGGEPVIVSPKAHDEMVSKTSHLPHLLSFLASSLVSEKEKEAISSGFRDFSRLAKSSPTLWEEIIQLNPFMTPYRAFRKYLKKKVPKRLYRKIIKNSLKDKSVFGKTMKIFRKKLQKTLEEMGSEKWLNRAL